ARSPTTPAASPSSAGPRPAPARSPTGSTPSATPPKPRRRGTRTSATRRRGNTTKALTKGYAIASASLAAFLLFSAYIDKINLIQGRRIAAGVPGAEILNAINLANVNVFIAALLAAMLVYFFSSLAIRAVGTTAQTIIVEVRRQFREMPGIMDYSQRPDYARVVDITTKAALREMVLPG